MIIFINQEINEFLNANALFIALGFVGLIVLVVGGIVCFNFLRKKKIQKQKSNNAVNLFYEYVGNKENVNSIKLNGSRLTIILNDYNLVNKEQLKTLGVVSIVALKDKMTLVLSEEGKKYFSTITD